MTYARFLIILIPLFLFLAAGGAYYNRKYYFPSSTPTNGTEKIILPKGVGQQDDSPPVNQNTTTINAKSEFEGPIITYAPGEGFKPREVRLNSATTGCILQITNQSDTELKIRLSPHHPADDWGFQYPVIAPRTSSLIDPRYRIPTIALHNFNNPNEEFSVKLDDNCL